MAGDRPGDTATPSSTIVRVTLLLRVLAEAEGDCSLTDIADRLHLPLSTTHRLLRLLMEQGFVDRGAGNRTYRAGLEFLRLGGLVTARAEITEVAQTFMQGVVDACDETCMLSLYVPRQQACMIAKVIHGSHPLRYEASMYRPTSLAWGATGRGILAFLPEDVIDAVLAREEPSPSDGRKLPKPAGLKRELAQIRKRGFAFTRSQKIPGAVGLSAPVFGPHGALGALCITLPESRLMPGMDERFSRTLVDCARRFSAALGHRPPLNED